MAKKISTVLASERSYKVRPFALLDHTHAFYPGAVADIAARDAITGDQRYDGSIVYVEADQTTYQLRGGSSNADWVTLVTVTGVASHTELGDIGTNTHTQIDSHIADATLHFTQASISITESQISDLQAYSLPGHDHAGVYLPVAGVAASTNALESATTTINVSAATAPTIGQVLTLTSTDTATWEDSCAGSGTAGGSNTQIQYNSAGVLSGVNGFTWDGTTLIFDGAQAADAVFVEGLEIGSNAQSDRARIQPVANGQSIDILCSSTGFSGVNFRDFIGNTHGIISATTNGYAVLKDINTIITNYQSGQFSIYHAPSGPPTASVAVARTETAANGGFEVNNTLTGAGFERVLTTGDLGVFATLTGAGVDNQIPVFDGVGSIDSDATFLWDQVKFTAGSFVMDNANDQLNIGGADLTVPGIVIDGSATASPFINLEQLSVTQSVFRYNNTLSRTELSSLDDEIALRPGNVDRLTLTAALSTLTTAVALIQDGYLVIDHTLPELRIQENDVALDQKNSSWLQQNETFNFNIDDDARANSYTWLTYERSGTGAGVQVDTIDFNAVTDVTINAPTFDVQGNITLTGALTVNDITALDTIQWNTALTKPAHTEGLTFYDKDEHTIAVYNDEADVTHQLGQEGYIRVYNNSGGTILNGEVVTASGEEGVEGRPTIALARSDVQSTSEVLGVATHDIENNTFGYITYWGIVNDVDTSAFNSGDVLHLSASTAGAVTKQEPSQGTYWVQIGYVGRVNATTGSIIVDLSADLSGFFGETRRTIANALKGSPGTINPGQVVYITGWNISNEVVEVELADASASATMPAMGVARDTITNTGIGEIVVQGELFDVVDTSTYTIGDQLYVSETTGALTNVKPTGTALVQKIAIVARSHASSGVVEIVGAGRSNDLPNLPTDNVWLGSGSAVPTATLLNLAAITDVTATAAEVNLLDLSGLTVGWVLSADSATTASWKAATGGGGSIGGSITDNQVAVGATTANDIEGSTGLVYDATSLTVGGAAGSPGVILDGSATGSPFYAFRQNSIGVAGLQWVHGTTSLNFDLVTGAGRVFNFRPDSATVALSIDQAFDVDIPAGNLTVFGNTTTTGSLALHANANVIHTFEDTGAALDQGKWRLQATNETFYGRLQDDANANTVTWLQVARSGTGASMVVDLIALNGPVTVADGLDITGNITLTGTVDGIDIATDVAANTLKVTNATHTGQVTGATALALDVTAITAQPASGAIVAADTIITNDGGILSEATFTQMITFFDANLTFAASGHTHLLAAGATDVTATAAEVNLLDLAGLTAGWVLSADTATTASWKAPTGGIGGSITNNQVAFGATTADDIEGDANFTYDGTTLTLANTNGIALSNGTPLLQWVETDGALDQKKVFALGASEQWRIAVYDDAGSNAYTFLNITRSGTGAGVQVDTLDLSAVTDITLNSDTIITGRLLATNSDDVDTAGVSGGLIIGGDGTGQHIAIDTNEIMSKATATTVGTLDIQRDGGGVNFGAVTDLTAFTVNATTSTFAGNTTTTGIYVRHVGANVIHRFEDTGAALDQGMWRLQATNETFYGRLQDDANANVITWLQVARSGTGASMVVDLIALNGPVTIDGNASIGTGGGFRSTSDANVDGPNFSVNTTTKTAAEYAFEILRSSVTVGGFLLDGDLEAKDAAFDGTVVQITNASNPSFIAVDTTNTVSTRMRSVNLEGQIGTFSAHDLDLIANSSVALTLDTSQNATFAGDITLATGRTYLRDSNADISLELQSGDATVGMVFADDLDGTPSSAYIATTNGNLSLRTGGSGSGNTGTVALTLNTSQSATFAGDVNIDEGATGNPILEFHQNTIQKAYIQYQDSGDLFIIDADGEMRLASANTTALTLDASQNATFAAKVIFDASTTADPSFNIPEGVAPTTPVDGDVWITAAGAFNARLNGSTVDLAAHQWVYTLQTGTTYTAVVGDFVVASNTGTVTITLPSGHSVNDSIIVKKTGATGTVTVDGNASETIDGATTHDLTAQYESITLISDGTNWLIV